VDMIETYRRNEAVPADADIKEVTFMDEVILVTYHKDPTRVTAQTRELDEPQLTEKQQYPPITSDEVSTFKVDPTQPDTRNFENSEILANLLNKKLKCKRAVESSLEETETILGRMSKENTDVDLVLSFYDTTRNAKSKARREEIETQERQAAAERELMERDYLAPFLTQHMEPAEVSYDMTEMVENLLARQVSYEDEGNQRRRAIWGRDWREVDQSGMPGNWSDELMNLNSLQMEAFFVNSRFTQEERSEVRMAWKQRWAMTIKRKCLEDLQLRLERQARLIQEWYENEAGELNKRKEWYEKNQGSLKPEEKEEYANFTDEVLFRMSILEKRLARHKNEASKRYVKLDHTLRNDRRLADFLL